MENKLLKPRKLTKKQRGFVNDYVLEENGTKAVLNNYNAKDNIVAKGIATENLTKPYIIEAIEVKRKSLRQALIDKGITEDYLADKVNVLLNAVDEKGKTDFTAVDKGLKHATNIYGIEDDENPNKDKNIYNFFLSKDTEEIKELEEKIKNKLRIHKHA